MSDGTTKKYRNFVTEPMKNKPVTDLPGIGVKTGLHLTEAGYDKAYKLLGIYLSLEKNERKFTEWMKSTVTASTRESSECYKCLNEWSEHFL